MTDIMVETSEYHGSLVAFEGPQDVISTQLRLLPTSPKILILPPFQHFAKEHDADLPFDARLQILRTHEACDARIEMAHNFLRESTPDNKRLVFMNGGTASAQMSCISAISKHKTNGDFIKAETIFSELAQDGITGLKQQNKPENGTGGISQEEAMADMDERDDEVPDDPISRAMRAADALDLETAFLQDTNDLDFTMACRPRSTSVPVLPIADNLQNVPPFYLVNPTDDSQNLPLSGGVEQSQLLYVEKWRAMMATEDQLPDPNDVPRSPIRNSEARPYELLRPTSAVGPPRATVESTPGSPALVAEARLVDMRSFIPPSHKRIKSVDRIYATAIRNQDIALCNFPQSAPAKLEDPPCKQNNTQEKENNSTEKRILRSNFYCETPYPTFSQSSRSIVRKALPSPLNLGTKEPKQPPLDDDQISDPGRNYVHRGTITEPIWNLPEMGTENNFELGADEPFQTVLPMVEDLVVHFKGEESEPKLEAMIQAFKHGRYPISMPPLLSEPKENTDQPGTPTTGGSTQERAEEEHSISIYSCDEYDPFAAHGDYLGYVSKHDISRPQETPISNPPTLSQGQSQSNTPPDKIFHDFDLKDCKTAVCIQNSLRSILNVYFPSENIGYHQFNFPLLPELNSLWRPVFREIPSGDSTATRKIDLILAIGAQKGVNKGLLSAITGSLEKLGREPNGASRSGRLDLR